MSRLSLFNSPLLLGFDHFERTLDRISKTGSEGYPPYNIEQVSDEALRITLAVAGFAIEDLEIQLEDNQLVVRGRQKDDPDRVYLDSGNRRRFVCSNALRAVGKRSGVRHVQPDLVRYQAVAERVLRSGRKPSHSTNH